MRIPGNFNWPSSRDERPDRFSRPLRRWQLASPGPRSGRRLQWAPPRHLAARRRRYSPWPRRMTSFGASTRKLARLPTPTNPCALKAAQELAGVHTRKCARSAPHAAASPDRRLPSRKTTLADAVTLARPAETAYWRKLAGAAAPGGPQLEPVAPQGRVSVQHGTIQTHTDLAGIRAAGRSAAV